MLSIISDERPAIWEKLPGPTEGNKPYTKSSIKHVTYRINDSQSLINSSP